MKCPRQQESPFRFDREYENLWDDADNTCRYCGSMNPDELMTRIGAGTVELSGSDKNYKVYVHNVDGEPFKQHFRDCGNEMSSCPGPDECTHWTTREMSQTKFYFQHFSEDQRQEFIKLHNAKKIKYDQSGLYVTPFFCQKRGKSNE